VLVQILNVEVGVEVLSRQFHPQAAILNHFMLSADFRIARADGRQQVI